MKVGKGSFLFLLLAVTGLIYIVRDSDNTPFQKRLLTLDDSRIKTTSTRMPIVETYCKGTTRASLISSAEKSTNTQYNSIMQTYFKTDLSTFIGYALNGRMDTLMTEAQALIPGIVVYVLPFLIGFLLGLTLWTCLCCCCTCPGCCPSKCCKCCRHDDELLYTKCELLWPAIFLLVVLLLAIAASIPGLTQAGRLASSFETIQCGVAIGLDDIMNGNTSYDKTTFFFGINTLLGIFNRLQGNLTDIKNNITSSNINAVVTDCNNIVNAIELVASGTANTSAAVSYNTPTPGSGTSVDSLFNTVLGNPTVTDSLLGVEYAAFNSIKGNMTQIKATIDSVSAAVADSSFSGGLTSAMDNFRPINNSISTYSGTITGIFDTISPFLNYLRTGTLVFFAVAIGFSVIALLGLILTAFFNKAKCRYLMYFACIFIVILVLLGFLISFVFSFLTPFLYMGCQVFNKAINTNVGFNSFVNDIGIQGVDMVKALSVCFPGGNGKILTALGISQLNDLNSQVDNMTSVMTGFLDYASFDTTPLTNADAEVYAEILRWYNGEKNDLVNDATSLAYLRSVADGSVGGCTDAAFAADSLVPSTNSNSTTFIPCAKSNIVKCTAAADRFNTLPAGCIDLTSCFPNYDGTGAGTQVATDFILRYSDPSCATLANNLGNLYTNWDAVRRSARPNGFNDVKTDYNSNVQPHVTQLATDIASMGPQFRSIFDTLNLTLSDVVDPSYGLVAGLNCLVLGEDIVNAKDTICVSFFNSIFFLLVTIGTTSFGLLFALCCIVCTGVRHYKQSETQGRILVGPEDPYDQTFVHLQEKQRQYPYP